MCQKSSIMVLRHVEMTTGMDMIALSKFVTFFPLTVDWLARLRVWSSFLCSKSPKFSYFEARKTGTTYCRALERQSFQKLHMSQRWPWAPAAPVPVQAVFLRILLLDFLPGISTLAQSCSSHIRTSAEPRVADGLDYLSLNCAKGGLSADQGLITNSLSWYFRFMQNTVPRAWLWLYFLWFYR